MSGQIAMKTVKTLRAELVTVSAYGPTTPKGVIPERHRMPPIPDVLRSSGGVITGYHERLHNRRSEARDLDVHRRLLRTIINARTRVRETARSSGPTGVPPATSLPCGRSKRCARIGACFFSRPDGACPDFAEPAESYSGSRASRSRRPYLSILL